MTHEGPVRSLRVLVPCGFALALTLVLGSAACTPVGSCSTSTCPGCCDADGVCREGSTNDACGSGALNCNVCSGGQVCTDMRCALPSTTMDGGSDAGTTFDAGMPIRVPLETWSWVNFPDSACGNGMPTGIGVNSTTRSRDVLIFLMGGGACWNALTCSFAATFVDTGYDVGNFNAETAIAAPPFNRGLMTNPFKDMNFVFVPYCTGDVHSGDAVTTHQGFANIPTRTVHHKGRANIDAYLKRLKDTWPDATRVFVTGSSAGAFGAQMNYQKVVDTWPGAEVHVLADCGQIINPSGSLLNDWTTAWNLAIPSDCVGCGSNFALFPKYLHDKFPNRRFGLYAYTQDNTLRQFFGYDASSFQTQTLALSASAYDTTPNGKYFIVTGAGHVMIDDLLTLTGPNNTSLLTWTSAFVRGEASWQSVK